MKKFIYVLFLILSLAFISCNADILMNNGEFHVPNGDNEEDTNNPTEINLTAPTRVNATKSFYPDSIAVSWVEVKGADYYTIEKTSHDTENLTGSEKWIEIKETISTNHFEDNSSDLSDTMYHSYRVTAHTNNGKSSPVSKSSTGTILSRPSNISVSKGTSETEINITWEEMPYVDSYVIYKSASETISGVESEIIAEIPAGKNATNGYAYKVDKDRESGVELYFSIKSVGETGKSSSLSLPRVGYSRNPNAPVAPVIISSTKGDSTEKITLVFSVVDSSFDVIIMRSASGAEEKPILDTSVSEEDRNRLILDDQGNLIFNDNSAMSGIEYKYSIQLKSEKGLSEAAETTAYLLSPVSNVLLTPINNGEKFGYELTYKLPVGANDESRTTEFTYTIKETFKNDEVNEYSVSEKELQKTYFYDFKKKVTTDEELTELKSISIVVSNATGEKTSLAKSNVIPFIPKAIESINATSNNKPKAGDKANSNGIYPVHVEWATVADSNFTLYRKGSDDSFMTFKTDEKFYIDETTKPLVFYEYWVNARDELGRTHGEPHATNAYGGITPETYKVMFESLSLKPWTVQDYVPNEYKAWWKQTEIAKKIEYGNAGDLGTQTQALGSASATDHFHGGTVRYNASMEGVGAQIYFDYEKFGENPNWSMTGSYEMHVNASGNGSAATKTQGFEISGMYPGHVGIQKITVVSKDFSGAYTITIKYSDGELISEVNVK